MLSTISWAQCFCQVFTYFIVHPPILFKLAARWEITNAFCTISCWFHSMASYRYWMGKERKKWSLEQSITAECSLSIPPMWSIHFYVEELTFGHLSFDLGDQQCELPQRSSEQVKWPSIIIIRKAYIKVFEDFFNPSSAPNLIRGVYLRLAFDHFFLKNFLWNGFYDWQ